MVESKVRAQDDADDGTRECSVGDGFGEEDLVVEYRVHPD